MFRSLPRSSAVCAAVWLSLTCVGSWPLFGQEAAPPAKAIAWREGQVKEAFVLALEENKRLVVAFLGTAAEKGRPNWSDRFSHELDRLELGKWADKAVFVRVRLVPQGEAGGDPEAQTMASKLKIEGLPMLSIIESRTDHLFESKRLFGFTPASEIPYFLDEALAQAKDLPVPEGAAKAIPAVPSAAPLAATPREALREYVEGTSKADLPRFERVIDGRCAEAFNQRLGAADALYAAKRRLLRALDAQFGPRADELPPGDDCEEVYAQMRELVGARLLSERQEEKNVVLTVEFTLRRGGKEITRTETILAIPDGESWKLLPTAALTAAEERARHNAATRKYAESLEQLADEVLAGKWAVRVFAREMADQLHKTAFAAAEAPPAATAPATEPAPDPAAAAAAPEKARLPLPTKEELASMRALPAVYRVVAFGDAEIDYPTELAVDVKALEARFEKEQAAGKLPADLTKSAYIWAQAAEDFGRCLGASAENRRRLTVQDIQLGHGSSVVVGREGFLLTNAHVVNDSKEDELGAEVVEQRFQVPCAALAKRLVEKLGASPPAELLDKVEAGLYRWYGMQCRVTGKVKQVAVALAYVEPPPAPDATQISVGLFGSPQVERRKPILFPARVIAKGSADENLGAMDVAILHVEGIGDRLITLPLAARDDVKKDTRAHALGYPGYLDDVPKPRSEFWAVHLAPGNVLSIPSPPVPGFDLAGISTQAQLNGKLIKVGCDLTHGMSGGPIVNDRHQVIGLTVSGFHHAIDFVESKYAVPIWNAKKMLDEQGIKLEASPLTTTWEEGLALYRAGDFAAAEAKFREIAARQVGQLRVDTLDAAGKPLPVKPTDDRRPIERHNIVSRYVQQMIALSAERQRK